MGQSRKILSEEMIDEPGIKTLDTNICKVIAYGDVSKVFGMEAYSTFLQSIYVVISTIFLGPKKDFK